MNKAALILATWFGAGYWPKGPGTAGSVAAILVALPLYHHHHFQPFHFLLLALALTPASVWAASRTERITGTEDPQIVVVDEVLGQWITLAAVPSFNWPWLLAALALFRLFDITKPWPVRRLEALHGGLGIVADDLMAGLYGALVIAALRLALPFMVQF